MPKICMKNLLHFSFLCFAAGGYICTNAAPQHRSQSQPQQVDLVCNAGNFKYISNLPGSWKLIEECATIDKYGKDKRNETRLPKEESDFFQSGNILKVCCPQTSAVKITGSAYENALQIDQTAEADYSYEGQQYNYEGQDNNDGQYNYEGAEEAEYDYDTSQLCKTKEACGDELNGDYPPEIGPCPWKEEKKEQSFLCGSGAVYFSEPQSSADECQDAVKPTLCAKWMRESPESCTNSAEPAFPFMQRACMNTCGSCGNKGCTDEFPKCADWARSGLCYDTSSSRFMAFNCRKSCATCGVYLGPNYNPTRNIQRDNEGNQYTDLDDKNNIMFCGRTKSKCEIDPSTCISHQDGRKKRSANLQISDLVTANIANSNAGPWFYNLKQTAHERGIFCGSTRISDRFYLSAAHCVSQIQSKTHNDIKLLTTRDGTKYAQKFGIKRVFKHPHFHHGDVYNDIAVFELDRPIPEDFVKYGDSAACLPEYSDQSVLETAVIQGYGETEFGTTSNFLLETNVSTIENDDCAGKLDRAAENYPELKSILKKGINEQLICSIGFPVRKNVNGVDTTIYSGPCDGDGGGPLYIDVDDSRAQKRSLHGIISGGIGTCGSNNPSWYTKVFAYKQWIKCIVRETNEYNNQEKVESLCKNGMHTAFAQNCILDTKPSGEECNEV